MIILDISSSFIEEHPTVFYTVVGFLVLAVVITLGYVIWRRHSYISIKCKVIEKDGNIRYTDVHIYESTGIYKIHAREGGWVLLTDEHKAVIEKCRKKRTIHGGHIKPEIKM